MGAEHFYYCHYSYYRAGGGTPCIKEVPDTSGLDPLKKLISEKNKQWQRQQRKKR